MTKITSLLFDNGGSEARVADIEGIYAQPKNFVDSRIILSRLLPRGSNRDGDDDEEFLKPLSIRKKSSNESNFVTKIKQFGIISGNASKYVEKKEEQDAAVSRAYTSLHVSMVMYALFNRT